MTNDQVLELQRLAFEQQSSLLHSLLALRPQFASDDQWSVFAITKLVEECKSYRDRLIRLTATMPPAPAILER